MCCFRSSHLLYACERASSELTYVFTSPVRTIDISPSRWLSLRLAAFFFSDTWSSWSSLLATFFIVVRVVEQFCVACLPFRAASIFSWFVKVYVTVATNNSLTCICKVPTMLQASSELYSCAPRVYMPAARAQKGAKVQNKAGGGNTKTTCCRPQLHGTPSSDVFELGKALKFDEEVVLSRCPQSLGYKKALEIGLNGGFIPGTTRERERTRPLALGRHNCRGELKRHAPCHLRSQSLPLDAKLLTTTAPRLFLEALENSTPIANSCVAPEVFPVVPSEEWEAKTLLRLSSATARRFRRQHGHDLTPPEAEPATTAAAAAAVPPTSRERRETPAAKPSLADEKSRDRNKAASTPATTARYLAEFLSGALPVHSPHCADTTIVLDNRSKYDKVLQDRFPHAPQRWCPGCNAPHVARACTRGVQRWTDLPQPSEVLHRPHIHSTSHVLIFLCIAVPPVHMCNSPSSPFHTPLLQ